MGSTLVAGSTSPGGRSATSFWLAPIAVTILSGGMHRAVAVSAGWLTVTPQGTTTLPLAASLVSSLRAMTDLRLVMPVTTASGNDVGGLVAVGVGVGVGEAEGAAVGEGDGLIVSLRPRQPARMTADAASMRPRGRNE